MGFFDWLRGGSRQVNAFEAAVLLRVENLLEPEMAERFRQRLNAISLVQRHGGGQEIYLYQKKGGKVVFPPETAILENADCVDFAEVETRSRDFPTSRLKAVIGLRHGNVASICFDKPSEHANLGHVEDMRAKLLGPPFKNPDDDHNEGWPA